MQMLLTLTCSCETIHREKTLVRKPHKRADFPRNLILTLLALHSTWPWWMSLIMVSWSAVLWFRWLPWDGNVTCGALEWRALWFLCPLDIKDEFKSKLVNNIQANKSKINYVKIENLYWTFKTAYQVCYFWWRINSRIGGLITKERPETMTSKSPSPDNL